MTDSIDITGLDKAAVLAALFNASAPQGFGFLQAGNGPQVMSLEDAQVMIDLAPAPMIPGMTDERALEYDYVLGRPLKVSLGGDEFNPWGFDRDNGGPGSAQKVIDRLRATSQVDTPESAETRESLTRVKAHQAMQIANTPTTFDGHTMHLGGDDAGAVLEQAVDAQMDRLKI